MARKVPLDAVRRYTSDIDVLTAARFQAILEAREAGESLRAIGGAAGMSGEGIRYMIEAQSKISEKSEE